MVKCCICGTELKEYDAVKLFTGRTKYMCKDCYKSGDKIVSDREMTKKKNRRLKTQ